MESNNNINGKDNQMLEKKRKRPTYGVLTLKPEELKRYIIDGTGVKRKDLTSNIKKKKVCSDQSKNSKKTSNKKNEKQK